MPRPSSRTFATRRLKFIAKLGYGDSLASEVREAGEVPVFGSNGQVGSHAAANTHGETIIVGRKGSYGKVNYSPVSSFAIDTTYFIDRTTTEENLRWLYYVLPTLGLDELTQDTGVPGLSRESAYEKAVPYPDRKDQKRIADYLDRETSAIDELVAEKEKMLALLEEKHNGLITHTVTRGLDPKAKMKASGVAWIGEIPERWEVRRLKWACNSIQTGGTPSPEYMEDFEDGTVDWYTPGDFNDTFLLGDSSRKISSAAVAANEAPLFPAGSVLVVGIGATLGKVGLLLRPASANQQINALLPHERIDPRYLTLLIWAIDDLLKSSALSSTLSILNQQRMGDISIPVPSLEEQRAIVKELDGELGAASELSASLRDSIRLLGERRAALITAVVTGQIDMAGMN